jgi:hypothetical protein
MCGRPSTLDQHASEGVWAAGNPVPDCAYGAVLRSIGNRIDGRGFGAAIHCLKPHLVRGTSDSCRADTIEGHSG